MSWTKRGEGGGRFSLWLIRTFASVMGRGVTRIALYPITLYFLMRRGPERRASREYLTRALGRPATFADVFRHQYTFAGTILDRFFMLSEQFRQFEITTHGLDELHAAHDLGRGVLLVGSHLGSFESLRVLSLKRPDITVRVVLDVGHNRKITEILDALNPVVAKTVIDGGRDGTSIVLAIKEAAESGAIVTLLGDRARPGDPSIAANVLGAPAEMPTSPWLIANALKVPVVLAFGLYRGGNRYDLYFEPFAESLSIDRRRRAAALSDIVQRYADRLSHYARLAPYNWFNFYDFWERKAPVDDAARGDDRDDGAPRIAAGGAEPERAG